MPAAPLSSSLFMMFREMPDYISVARSVKYKNTPVETNLFKRIWQIFCQYLGAISDILTLRFTQEIHDRNYSKLDKDFTLINQIPNDDKKPICVYFVSGYDPHGALIGNAAYYYHHYKIQNFQKYYNVQAYIINSGEELENRLKEIGEKSPRGVKLVDIVCHGAEDQGKRIVVLGRESKPNSEGGDTLHFYASLEIHFPRNCRAEDAAIIFDACSAGKDGGVAEQTAAINPGVAVFAPGRSLCFSKPVFKANPEKEPIVDHVVHGFALINAYTNKQFQVTSQPKAPSFECVLV